MKEMNLTKQLPLFNRIKLVELEGAKHEEASSDLSYTVINDSCSLELKKINTENQKLKNELVNKLIDIKRSYEMVNRLKSKIKNLDIDFSKKSNLLKTINSYKDNEMSQFLDTDIFELNKQLVLKLTALSKSLTSNNLKLCILVYKRMSTKEISRVLHLTPNSAKVAKHRLRKKLGINQPSKTLVSFLHAL